MLLTLATSCLRPLLKPVGRSKPRLDLLDLPRFARQELGLHGLTLTTDLLAGASRQRLEALREQADKAACACLVLVEHTPQPFAEESDDLGDSAIERTERVIQAAHVLGCNAAAIQVSGPDNVDAFERAADRLRMAVERAEKLELNLLLVPGEGLTARPERVTELIKSVGRFRVMTFPDFERASAAPDAGAYLKRLTPYAGAVSASTTRFAGGESDVDYSTIAPGTVKHTGFDLGPMVDAIKGVGFDGALSIDYRGPGDVTLGVLRSRAALEGLLYEPRPGDDEIDDLLGELEDGPDEPDGAEE
ncbi:MAG: sugar phosphate isomerase/epimerase [Phycisphaerales bacterium]|nr:sugar phosphate isomerase/epimerase [Phycisphaerales bacterium]